MIWSPVVLRHVAWYTVTDVEGDSDWCVRLYVPSAQEP